MKYDLDLERGGYNMNDLKMTEILLSAEYMQETTEVMEFLATLNPSEQREFFCFTQGIRYAQGQKMFGKTSQFDLEGEVG